MSARNGTLNLKSGHTSSLISAAFEGGNDKSDQNDQSGLSRKMKSLNSAAGTQKEKGDMRDYLKDVKELVDPTREVSELTEPIDIIN